MKLDKIQVIEDNAGGIFVQDTSTKEVAHFDDVIAAWGDLTSIIKGGDMDGWKLSHSDYYLDEIGPEYRLLDDEGIMDMLGI